MSLLRYPPVGSAAYSLAPASHPFLAVFFTVSSAGQFCSSTVPEPVTEEKSYFVQGTSISKYWTTVVRQFVMVERFDWTRVVLTFSAPSCIPLGLIAS